MSTAQTASPMRSLLFMPGNREKFLLKAAALPADGLVLDLEDAVPADEKPSARALLRTHVPKLGQRQVWVRVNPTDSPDCAQDLEALIGLSGLQGLWLPKTQDPAVLRDLDARLSRLEGERGVPSGSTRLILQVETARAVWLAYELATATPRVETLCFASARDGDLMLDLGCDWSENGRGLLHARQHTLLAARAAGCAWPLDGVFVDIADRDGFERDTRLSRSLGYRGRTVIHPSQIEAANRLYAPSAREVETSQRLLSAFDAAEREGRGSTMFEGRMIDRAMANAARKIVAAQVKE